MDFPKRAYVICTTPRCGSTMLCKMLAATGVAGNPGSLFHEPSLEAWLDYYDLKEQAFSTRQEALRAMFSAAIRRGRGETNVFGLRLQRGSLDFFMEQLSLLVPGQSNDVARFEAMFGRTQFIYLSRKDRLGQAISRLRAEQSGLWHRHADGRALEQLDPQRPPGYDRVAIETHLDAMEMLNEGWERWFAQVGLSPLRICYERLSCEPRSVVAEILATLGQDPVRAAGLEPLTRKLADETSQVWRRRFEAER